MQHIVLLTANPKPLLNEPGWMTNGVGRQYSLKFGYGLMDADAMVELAQMWPGAGQQGGSSVLSLACFIHSSIEAQQLNRKILVPVCQSI